MPQMIVGRAYCSTHFSIFMTYFLRRFFEEKRDRVYAEYLSQNGLFFHLEKKRIAATEIATKPSPFISIKFA